VITNVQDDTIQTIDLSSGAVYGPFLAGQLGSGQELLDAATTPDGHYALLSNWEAQSVFIVDLTRPTNPSLAASVSLPFPPEDVAVAPNGQFAVATDGGTSNQIAAIDLNSRSLAGVYSLRTSGAEAVSVAIGADNQTVVVTDANSSRIIFGAYNPYSGFLNESTFSTGSGAINVAISPDGRTVLVANAWDNSVSAYAVTSPGQLSPVTIVGGLPQAPQTIVFSPSGGVAYILSDASPQERLSWLNVSGPGAVSVGGNGVTTLLPTAGKVYYGVDGLAASPDGRALVCTNAASGTQSAVALVDPSSFAVRTISTGGQYPVGVACFDSGSTCNRPALTAQPQSQTISSGQSATLSVSTSGDAPISYQWYRGPSGDTSQLIAGATRISYTTPPLMATVQYWVRVSNSCGHADSGTATITVQTAPPPLVATMTKLGSPFRISVAGSNLQAGMHIYINGSLWSYTSWKSTGKIVLKGGTSLKSAVPSNTPTQFTFVNPDGGSVTKTWQWP
jgi:DNA-binding beta-propeller fold protein YncE